MEKMRNFHVLSQKFPKTNISFVMSVCPHGTTQLTVRVFISYYIGIFPKGEDSRGDHGLGRSVEFRFKDHEVLVDFVVLPPGHGRSVTDC